VTPLGRVVGGSIEPEHTAQVKGLPSGDGFEDGRVAFGDDLERGLLLFVTVRPGDIEVVPVKGEFLPEVVFGAEGFPVKELVFHETMNGFDITLPGMGFDGDVVVAGTEDFDEGREPAVLFMLQELGTVVGLPFERLEVHPMPSQVGADPFGEQAAIGLAEFIGVAGEGQAADDLAGGVLELRQAETGHLWPILRDIVEVLAVGRELLKEPPAALDLPQILLRYVLAFAGTDEVMCTGNALDSANRAVQPELFLETFRAEAGLLLQVHHVAFHRAGRLVRTVVRPPRLLL